MHHTGELTDLQTSNKDLVNHSSAVMPTFAGLIFQNLNSFLSVNLKKTLPFLSASMASSNSNFQLAVFDKGKTKIKCSF